MYWCIPDTIYKLRSYRVLNSILYEHSDRSGKIPMKLFGKKIK